MWLRTALMIVPVLLLTGCSALMKGELVPARIPVHTPESLAELRQTAKTLLNDKEAVIAASAFTKSHRLILSRKPIRDPNGRIIQTRVDEEPISFELFLTGKDCYLVRPDTGSKIRLTRAECMEI